MSAMIGSDDFNGDTEHLRSCMKALVELDMEGALVPHGIGGHARGLLTAAYHRLALAQPVETGAALPSDGREALLRLLTEAREALAALDRYSRRNQSELLIDVDTGRTPTDLIAEIDAALAQPVEAGEAVT